MVPSHPIYFDVSLSPSQMNYDQNSLLTVKIEGESIIQAIYADLTSLGLTNSLSIDPVLRSGVIYVSDQITAGIKNIPVTVIDEYGTSYTESVSLTILPKYSNDFDWDETRIYFLLTDRFYDGNPLNNGIGYDKRFAESYHGGDFAGVTAKLDYLCALGINTIWITPIVDNVDYMVDSDTKQYGYHGYWARSFTKIDEHLGTLEDFYGLLDAAHDRGIKIMVDVVLNHAGYGSKNNPLFQGMFREYSGHDPVTLELSGLPDFITEDPEVRKKLIDWQTAWAKLTTKKGNKIDYYRIDTVKHVDSMTWISFKNELIKINPGFKLIGEYFDANIDSTGGYLGNGQMDSLLDFSFKSLALRFVNGDMERVERELEYRNSKLSNYLTMGQFLSSHDEDGFLCSKLNGDTAKMKIAATLQITAKGQPVIYYGEEINLSGPNAYGLLANNRYDMQWDHLTAEQIAMLHHYTKLLNIRGLYSKILSKGNRSKIGGSDHERYLAFSREYNGEYVIVAVNIQNTPQTVYFRTPFEAGMKLTDYYNEIGYTVDHESHIAVQIPSSQNGGTVILAKG
ncbi:Neopullulanase 2 [compost metagenome]